MLDLPRNARLGLVGEPPDDAPLGCAQAYREEAHEDDEQCDDAGENAHHARQLRKLPRYLRALTHAVSCSTVSATHAAPRDRSIVAQSRTESPSR